MDARAAGEHRTALAGVVAHRDRVVEPLTGELLHGLGALEADVDAYLPHHGHSERAEALRVSARAVGLEAVAGQVAQQPLRHLAASAVSGTHEEQPSLGLTRHRWNSGRRSAYVHPRTCGEINVDG